MRQILTASTSEENLSNLWNIANDLVAIYEILQDQQGEMSELDMELLNDISSQLESKTDNVVQFIEASKANIKFLKDQRMKLSDAIRARENALERFNEYVSTCLVKTGRKQFDGQMSCIKLRKPSEIVEIIDQDELPVQYLEIEQTIKVKKADIKRDLKSGQKIDGARLKPSEKPSINYKLTK